MEDPEAQLTVSEADALGADFITVELDTQPIEYVVKWAEAGSKFTISCVKKDSDDGAEPCGEQLKVDADEAFFAPYEEVYPCEVTEQSVEIKMESDEGEEVEEEEEEEDEEERQILLEVGAGEADSEPEERRYRCGFCGKCYSHASSLYRHQQTHAAKMAAGAPARRVPDPTRQDARYACQHCGVTFKGSRMLGSHLRLHGKRRIHPCNLCGKEFNHSSSLSRHRLIHKKARVESGGGGGPPHGPSLAPPPHGVRRPPLKGKKAKRRSRPPASGDKFYACPQCDMSFRTSTQLSKHQVTHVKELLDSYAQPGKENVAESSSDLKIRLKLCSRDKPNFYTLCKKNRRRRRARRGGERDAEDEQGEEEEEDDDERSGRAPGGAKRCKSKAKSKTFTCAICGKTFMHSSSFSRHKKAHLPQRAVLDETAPIESDSD